MEGQRTIGALASAQATNGQNRHPRAYERPCAIALLTQINSHYGNKPLDDVQIDNFINEIDHTIKADEARQAVIEFFRTHSSRDSWLTPYDINRMVRRQRLSCVPSTAEISRMLDGYGITDAATAWGFRRGLTFAISQGASREQAISYARKHCDDVKTISNTPSRYPRHHMDMNANGADGVSSFASLLKGFREGLEQASVRTVPARPGDNPNITVQNPERKEETVK